ncbi:MAG: C4-type zinc ribbon domain-containing protein [Tannerellaceae bacterium]|jgi:predicted  nucleic acid-binding Zn-ribbon protein|nr:C4-type zinc ribbon domain-containing protein [Tannerellaceae bacterium]
MAARKASKVEKEYTVEEKLFALYRLQSMVTEIDKIRTLRGELPLEVQDLEDEVAGLETRLQKYTSEIRTGEESIATQKKKIAEATALISKYKTQLDTVRNNREFDSLSKEIEYQELEITLAEKKMAESTELVGLRKGEIGSIAEMLNQRKEDLTQKKSELDEIVSETRQEEDKLREKAKALETNIEPRLLAAFKRIRKGTRNGLAVVDIQRDACAGCFNNIPPQKQMDIKMRKKIIVCEYCGRILVDAGMSEGEK